MQTTLPFVTQEPTAKHQLQVSIEGPRSAPQFVASGGRLETLEPAPAAELRPLEYPKPLPTETGELPDALEVDEYIEQTAHVLYELIQDTYELARVAARFDTPGAKPDRKSLAFDLYAEIADINRCYGEVLENFCPAFGEDAALQLSEWLGQVANRVDAQPTFRMPAPPEPGW